MAAAFIDRLQSEGVAACIKPFVCNEQEYERFSISSEVSERPLPQTYLEPFRIAPAKSESLELDERLQAAQWGIRQ